jgi:hypothetical protein
LKISSETRKNLRCEGCPCGILWRTINPSNKLYGIPPHHPSISSTNTPQKQCVPNSLATNLRFHEVYNSSKYEEHHSQYWEKEFDSNSNYVFMENS